MKPTDHKPRQAAAELIIQNVRVLQPGMGIVADSIRIRRGKIVSIGVTDTVVSPGTERIDGDGRLLTPGLIDVHTHGIGYYSYESGPEELINGLKELAQYGTTCALPTCCLSSRDKRLEVLEKLARAPTAVEGTCAVPGLHLEGPFLALPGAGADTAAGDVSLLRDILGAAHGRLAAMSISPDTPNILPVIEYLCEQHVVPFITHTSASVEQTQAAIDAGARHATHFYDVFPLPLETDPGVRPAGAVETVLADPRCTVDFICDGVHVHPVAVQVALAAKGYQGVLLATDSVVGAGLPAGTYDTSFGHRVRIDKRGNPARICKPNHPCNGMLSGSSLTMNMGIRNLIHWLDLPAEQVWAMATVNPARVLSLKDKGVIREGADADVVLWDDDCRVSMTFVNGICVYRAD